MTTNIGLLPQITAAFLAVRNADWRDAIQFMNPSAQTQPLDITGIGFHAQVRDPLNPMNVILDLSVTNGGLVNGGVNGTLTFNIPRDPQAGGGEYMLGTPAGAFEIDIIAFGDGNVVNLFAKGGPGTVTIGNGVTF